MNKKNRYTHTCYLCGAPCTSKTCQACFNKDSYHSVKSWWRPGHAQKLQAVRNRRSDEKASGNRSV